MSPPWAYPSSRVGPNQLGLVDRESGFRDQIQMGFGALWWQQHYSCSCLQELRLKGFDFAR